MRCCCLLLLFSLPLQADWFAPLDLPSPTLVRTATGEPGSEYWQQQVDYRIEAWLEPATGLLQAEALVRYHNAAPQALPILWFEFPLQRLAEPEAAPSLRQLPKGARPPVQPEYQPSGLESLQAFTGNKALELRQQGTFYGVVLPESLPAGAVAELRFVWQLKLPNRLDPRRPRGGVETLPDGRTLVALTQWYPRAVAFSDQRGWDLTPFLGDAEFNLELGNFDVRLQAPADYLLFGTGELQNPDVFTVDERQHWQSASGQSRVTQAGDASEWRQWHFKAELQRDFALVAGNAWRWQTKLVDLPDQQVRLQVAFPDNGRWLWQRYALAATEHSVRQLQTYLGPFPVNTLTIANIAGIGMEFPGLKLVGFRGPDAAIDGPVPAYSRTQKHDVLGGIMHEVAHAYYPMLVNTDERREGFFDEGIASFLAYLLEQSWSRSFQSFYGDPAGVAQAQLRPDYAAPVTRADHFVHKLDSHYHVPAVALVILRQQLLGTERFDQILRDFTALWAGKRPYFADFIRFVSAQSGLELDWFWRGWFFSDRHVDIALTKAEILQKKPENQQQLASFLRQQARRDSAPLLRLPTSLTAEVEQRLALQDHYSAQDDFGLLGQADGQPATDGQWLRLQLHNRGGIPMPLQVQVSTADGKQHRLQLPVDSWRAAQQQLTVDLWLASTERIRRIELDPERLTGDVDPGNQRIEGPLPIVLLPE
ncbi:MAG: hypothetical protein JJU30_05790 [Alkalimonas sp.]|nr:hypothetical protein [Alkalimonas sp.]